MTTTLDRFRDYYASTTVATYVPLITPWFSAFSLGQILQSVAFSASMESDPVTQRGRALLADASPAALAPQIARRVQRSRPVQDSAMASPQESVREAYLVGAIDLIARLEAGTDEEDPSPLVESVADLVGPAQMAQLLSPIGIAHYYRQLFFHDEEGVGPLEEAFTIAPLEVLEVSHSTEHRQVFEEESEYSSETVSERAQTEMQESEISNKASSLIERGSNVSIAAKGNFYTPIWSASASSEVGLSKTTGDSVETATRELRQSTTTASERITNSMTLRVSQVEEYATTSSRRRTIRNESSAPVSYGLRRVLRKVRVKVQYMGPRLVWQCYLEEPGNNLARGQFVHFMPESRISTPETPPDAPAMPVGGKTSGEGVAQVGEDDYIRVTVNCGSDREVTFVQLDSMWDYEGKKSRKPSWYNTGGEEESGGAGVYVWKFKLDPDKSKTVGFSYTYSYEPSEDAMTTWEDAVEAAQSEADQEAYQEAFERAKELITARSKLPQRSRKALRREENHEIMNQLVAELFGSDEEQSVRAEVPSPLDIELLHRYLDLDALFYTVHPSWWKPSPYGARPPYEVTEESEPAPFGESLGWNLDIGGDDRRNAFLNSPWVRVCIPLQVGEERAAIDWLATNLEGQTGYDPESGTLSSLLEEVEEVRENEETLGSQAPEYVSVESTMPASTPEGSGELSPEIQYPIVDDYTVTVGTPGFVYDELKIGDLS